MPFFGVPIRNGLPIGLGSSAGFGIQPFDPSYLFAAGEQGAWYDPSDYSTLFQDSAGTTPVTAVEQSVGLMLDKSKGLVLGPELVTNGTFHTDVSGWSTSSANVTISWDSGRLKAVNGGTVSSTFVYQQLTTVVGRWYKAVLPVTNGTFRAFVSTDATLATTVVVVDNEQTFYFLATTTTSTLGFRPLLNNSTLFADNISVKEITGNHAYQSTSTSRPVLRARYNLLTYSEQFDNAAWTKFRLAATANAAVAPDGTTTSEKLVPSAALTGGFVYNTTGVSITSGAVYTASVYVKAAELGFAFVCNNSRVSSTAAGVCVNLSDGSTSNAGASGTYTVTNVGNGWWRVTATTTASTTSGYLEVSPLAVAGTYGSYTGNGTSGIYVWGAQLIVTNSLTSNNYQRIAAATDYDTTGFLPYLAFDGVDDSMLTNSVNFTATDKMTVWSGLRKLSDAADAVFVELSATVNTNNGSFGIFAPSRLSGVGTFDKYVGSLRGTAQSVSALSTYAAPITNVLSAQYDIAGATIAAESIYRVNGATPSEATNGVLAGTGNFGNYPIFIGRRNNTNVPFNGNLFSLIIRGAQSTASQISATETWVNGKTGAY